MPNFNMPDATATFEARGGWVINALTAQFDLALFQAAGIVGNTGFESGGFKLLREIGQPEGRGGYGWGQWTADRREMFLAFAQKHGLEWRSDEANYGYLVQELSGSYHNTIVAVKRTATIDAAVFSVGQTYERPGGTTPGHLPGYADRLAWAKRALSGAQSTVAAPGTVVIPPAGVTAPPAPTLQLNSYGPTVTSLQVRLNKLGASISVDGDFGNATETAVIAFQKANGLTPDGIVGPASWAALDRKGNS